MSEVGRGRIECFEHCATSSRVQSTRELVVRYNQPKLRISIKTLPSSLIPHVNMFGVSDIPKTIVSAEETGEAHIAIFLKRFKGVGCLKCLMAVVGCLHQNITKEC